MHGARKETTLEASNNEMERRKSNPLGLGLDKRGHQEKEETRAKNRN